MGLKNWFSRDKNEKITREDMFKNEYLSDWSDRPSGESYSFPLESIWYRKGIDKRLLNQPRIASDLSYATQELIISLQYHVLEGRESRTVEQTCAIPHYRTRHSYWPESTWDAIKSEISHFKDRINQWMSNIRFSGWLWSKEPITEVERWLRTVQIPYKLKKLTHQELIKTEVIDRVTVVKKFCPHHHGSATSTDCVRFLSATAPYEIDADTLQSIVPYLESLIRELNGNQDLYYSFQAYGQDRFIKVFRDIQSIIERAKLSKRSFSP